MTRPMSEEREKAIKVAGHVLRAEELYGPSTVILARALLSTSAAERGMREALEERDEHIGALLRIFEDSPIQNAEDRQRVLEIATAFGERAIEQARGQGRSAPTDTKE